MLSSSYNKESHTTPSACTRYRPIHPRRVGSARVAFPTARLHSLQANAMSGQSDARYASLADTLWKAFCLSSSSSSWSSGAFGLAPPGPVSGRADWSPSSATASSACPWPASHVNPQSLHDTQRFNTVASLSCAGPNLAFCTSSSFSFSFCDTRQQVQQ